VLCPELTPCFMSYDDYSRHTLILLLWGQLKLYELATWKMWYIDEGFLVWIIPWRIYPVNPESEIVQLVLSILIVIACLIYLSHVYMYLCFSYCLLCIFPFQTHRYTWFTVIPLISFVLLVVAYICMPGSHHLIMYTCDCLLCTPFGFIICTRRVASTTLYSHIQILELGPWWPYCSWSECTTNPSMATKV